MEGNKKVFNYEITGAMSGDYENFCIDVTEEEYERLYNQKPPRKGEESYFFKNLFRTYEFQIPAKIQNEFDQNSIFKIKATFEIEEVGKAEPIYDDDSDERC